MCWQKLPDLRGEHSYIANESVYRAIARSKNFKGRSKFSTWFHRIVLNECNRILKVKQEKDEISLDAAGDKYIAIDNDVFEEICYNQIAEMGQKSDRVILEMYRIGYSSREIARKLKMSTEQVRKRWQRLRERLKDLMV